MPELTRINVRLRLLSGTASTAFWTLLKFAQPCRSTVKIRPAFCPDDISITHLSISSHLCFLLWWWPRRTTYWTNEVVISRTSPVPVQMLGLELVVIVGKMVWKEITMEIRAMEKAEIQSKRVLFAFVIVRKIQWRFVTWVDCGCFFMCQGANGSERVNGKKGFEAMIAMIWGFIYSGHDLEAGIWKWISRFSTINLVEYSWNHTFSMSTWLFLRSIIFEEMSINICFFLFFSKKKARWWQTLPFFFNKSIL